MYILTLFILFLFANKVYSKNSCKHSNLDIKMRALTKTLGEASAKWPENKDQEMKFCSEQYEASVQAKFFKRKCYQGISKSLMKFTIHALEYNNVLLTCKNEEEMKRFLKRGKCGNKGKTETGKCWKNWIKKLALIKNGTGDKVAQLCCSLNQWKKCCLDVYRGLGSRVCSKKSIDGFDKYMHRSIVSPMNTIFSCDEYDTKQCNKLSKLTSNRRAPRQKYQTPFPLILEISDSL